MSAMIEVKVAELSGKALDWAVAHATGVPLAFIDGKCFVPWGTDAPGCARHGATHWQPSKNWTQGGPLVGLYHVLFDETDDGQLLASCTVVPCPSHQLDRDGEGVGQDHLVAACRAICAAQLGPTVSVPAELIEDHSHD